MADELLDAVLDRAGADETLPEAAKLLVLAALDGADTLDAELAPHPEEPASAREDSPSATRPDDVSGAADDRPVVRSARAYLVRVRVEGFRGIGAAAVLTLKPGPGLTVVAGRNGCGKSSFAEALELALTRRSYRWSKRSAVWSECWRNLHQGDPASVTVQLAEEGAGTTTVAAEWAAGASLDQVKIWTQRPGHKRGDLADLGWDRDLELFRPFLSYDELGALFAEPSKLHDALAGILGLDRLEDGVKLLATRAKELSAHAVDASRAAKQLLPQLQANPDERATTAATLMKGRKPDLDAVSALVTGATPPDPLLALLRDLAGIQAPDASIWTQARAPYDAAITRRSEALTAAGVLALSSTSLLRAAITHHDQSGDGPCPVCGQGSLDTAWAQRTRAVIEDAGVFAAAVEQADADLTAARQVLNRSVPPVPQPLARAVQNLADAVPSAATAIAAWQALQAAATDPETQIAAGEVLFADAEDTIATVVAQATAALAAREDAWQPLAVELAQWLSTARHAAETADAVTALKAAAAWLKGNVNELRNARLEPLADKAREIWSALRQESNVDLGTLTLEGSATRRRVELMAEVDGEAAGAFGVMSQGELHALALALFLPRATAQQSPFGFIVIDDPVQAMDPTKVDGLAQVLARTAQDQQVVVLTHDDRLPEAIRRLQIPAHILEVTRDTSSKVSVGDVSDPAERYLSDARAVASDKAVPPGVAAQVIPELCRMALESTCLDAHYRTQLLQGRPRADVERDWADATTTRGRLALVVRGSADATLDSWLNTPRRKAALGICTSALHQGLNGSPHQAVDDVQHLIRELVAAHGR